MAEANGEGEAPFMVQPKQVQELGAALRWWVVTLSPHEPATPDIVLHPAFMKNKIEMNIEPNTGHGGGSGGILARDFITVRAKTVVYPLLYVFSVNHPGRTATLVPLIPMVDLAAARRATVPAEARTRVTDSGVDVVLGKEVISTHTDLEDAEHWLRKQQRLA